MRPRAGVLATPCGAHGCRDGSAVWLQSFEGRPVEYSAPCDECHGTGYIVHPDIRATATNLGDDVI